MTRNYRVASLYLMVIPTFKPTLTPILKQTASKPGLCNGKSQTNQTSEQTKCELHCILKSTTVCTLCNGRMLQNETLCTS